MVRTCVYCGSKRERGGNRSFHVLPFSQPDRLESWLINMGLDKRKVTTASVLCSDHFEPQFLCKTSKEVVLASGSVPTLFKCYKSACVYCNVTRGSDKRSFHKFPLKNPEMLKKWLANMGLKKFSPEENSILCSDHFDKACFQCPGTLKRKAIPTIFESTVKEPAYQPSLKRQSIDSSDDKQSCEDQKELRDVRDSSMYDISRTSPSKNDIATHKPSIPCEAMRSLVDHNYVNSPRNLYKIIDRLQRENDILRKENRKLKVKLKRRNVKVSSLNDIVTELNRLNNFETLPCFSSIAEDGDHEMW